MHIKTPLRSVKKILLKSPIEAQLIVTRRCNLSCGYCTEYDSFSQPIPLETLKERIDALHRLQVINITLLGGEPLLHPQIDEIVAYAERQAQVAITTNGFLLSEKLIERLNKARLTNMQVSIDTIYPDSSGYIQKSFKSIEPKLRRLKQLAKFGINVNIVLCDNSKEQFIHMIDEIQKFGFSISVNLIHDENGTVEISGSDFLELWEYHFRESRTNSLLEYDYGKQLLQGQRPTWQCRAGSRYLYVDELGKVQFCSAQQGRLNKPVTEYTTKDIQKHAGTVKGCEAGCSIFCGYRSSQVDKSPFYALKAALTAYRQATVLTKDISMDLA